MGKAARLAVQPPAAVGQGRLSAVGSTTRQRRLVGNPLERRKLAALAGMAALGRSGRGRLAGEEGRAPNLAREPRSACAPTDPPPGNWLEEALARRGLPGSSRELQALVSRLSKSVATEAVEQAL